jgi:hypothetical protein
LTALIITTLSDPCQDIEYFILNDDTRNVNYGHVSYGFFDNSGYGNTSPDWRGSNWYRMVSPAGTMIPESVIESYHCNTYRTGWLNGVHPTIQGHPWQSVIKCTNFCLSSDEF